MTGRGETVPACADPVPIVFIVGKGRSGSTLLDTLLGQIDGLFSAGELMRVWEWGLVEGYDCGCGLPLRECPLWTEIVADLTKQLEADGIRFDAEQVAHRRERVLRWPNALRLLAARPGRIRWRDLDAHVTVMAQLYKSISHVSGGAAVVDSSKLPIEPAILGLVPDVDVTAVHLVRDPRAVVYSWKRRRVWTDRPGDTEMERYSVLYSVASWMARNLASEVVARRHRRRLLLTYESLVRDPAGAIRAIARAAGIDDPDLGFLEPDTPSPGGAAPQPGSPGGAAPQPGSPGGAAPQPAAWKTAHTTGGNPGRMQNAARKIRPDDEWIEELPATQWVGATLATFPLLLKYGYPLTRSAARRARDRRSGPPR